LEKKIDPMVELLHIGIQSAQYARHCRSYRARNTYSDKCFDSEWH
jgi:hypothetical protein